MEASGQYGDCLAEYLFHEGWEISVVNPARIKAYARSKLRRNKTDKVDAELIAEYCLREQPNLWSPPPASFKGLQALVRRLEDLQTNYYQENNRLKAGETNPLVTEGLRDHLQYLKMQIKKLKQDIQEHIDANLELKQRHELLLSIPGIGKLTAAKILGEIRDICDFDNARQLAAYAGVTPHNYLSGTSVHKKSRMSKIGNSNLRKALYMPAISAKKYNPIIKIFCTRLIKSGKPFDPNFLNKQAFAS